MDARMAKALSFRARFGHPCGKDFLVGPFLKAHPEFAWQASELGDLIAGPWALFRAGEREERENSHRVTPPVERRLIR